MSRHTQPHKHTRIHTPTDTPTSSSDRLSYTVVFLLTSVKKTTIEWVGDAFVEMLNASDHRSILYC